MIFILLSPVFLSQDLKVFYDIMTRKYHNQLTRLKESPGFTVAGIIAFTIVISLTVWPQADRLADRLAESGFGLTNLSEPDVPDLSLGAIDFINRYPGIIPKRMFTSYNNGSAYTFFTGRPAFIDSRGISSEFFQEYMRITNPAYVPRNDFKLLVDKYNLEGFISRVINVNLLRKLYLDGRYEPVYIDKQMVICLRNDTVTDTQWQGLRQRFRDELENQVLVLQPSGPSAVDLDLINMAAALISLEQTDAALAILTRCAARSPTTFAAQYNAGMGFLKKNDCAQAYEYFRRALILEPASIPALAAASITAEPAGRGDSGVAYAALLRAKTTPELREKIKHHYALLGLPILLSLEP